LLDPSHRERWGLVLAGGEGRRLRELTQAVAGDDRASDDSPHSSTVYNLFMRTGAEL
jgi:hypothetical protein